MDRKLSLICIAIATCYLFLSYRLPEYPYAIMDADVIPKGLGFLLVILAFLLFLQNKQETEQEREKRNVDPKEIRMLLVVLIIIIIYIFLLEIIGFVINTFLFLLVLIRLLGYKKWLSNTLVSIILPIVIYFAFNYLLKIYLPQGILPF
ncbi:tripartite tricarboxylate transporter TctB family protein [Bacillus sp. SM2101]|nr:tripartite tricarboxylate transporter TctB family protein [Bacillus sp. SM2101]